VTARQEQDRAALTLEVSGDGVAWLVFDRPDSRVNLLTSGVLARLDALLGEIEEGVAAALIRAVVVRSGKDGTFVAGADVNEIAGIRDAAEGEAAAREGQRIFRRLELLAVPTVAAVDGICVGGGTEMILACGHRVASDRPETKIGLPEVRLGILPGFGGTTRLPRLIGLREALGMILTGRNVDARRARRIGLIDEAVHPAILIRVATTVALDAANGRIKRAPRAKGIAARLLDRTAPGRTVVLRGARQRVLKETGGHYPAPLTALDVIARSVRAPLDKAFALEARALGRLIVTRISKNLIHVFQLMESAKKAAPAAAPAPVLEVFVLGAGVMGGGIAQLAAAKGRAVRLKDIRAEAIGTGLAHAQRVFDRSVAKRRIDAREAVRAMARIAPTLGYAGLGSCDLVIEAVVERMDVKKDVLREAESRSRPGTVLASNTSTLSITEMAGALERPDDFCGMHFFNPVDRMPLVEVIRGRRTSDATAATVFAFARALDKTPVIVKDGPGFLVNRILSPYLNEAGHLLGEGAEVQAVDRVLLDFGMPMGPLRLLDEVGLDVARHAAEVLFAAFGERMRPAPALAALDLTRLLGRKGGRGFYLYEDDRENGVNEEIYETLGAAVPPHRSPVDAEHVRDRTLLAMVNEAARTLEDGIARNAGDVDLAMITGTGFPPFRGGLLRWADSLGTNALLSKLETLEGELGPRFAPAPLLRELAAANRGFYG
jgi:3-hydroxyacyl-CoA dehydrogenase/enoyl-CoA hydratase/3-hydroxybutyryl-CoA epimerase